MTGANKAIIISRWAIYVLSKAVQRYFNI